MQPLPDRPGEWGIVDDFTAGRFRQRWMPGAFGARPTIEGVRRYRVLRDQWDDSTDPPSRTILEAVVMDRP